METYFDFIPVEIVNIIVSYLDNPKDVKNFPFDFFISQVYNIKFPYLSSLNPTLKSNHTSYLKSYISVSLF